MPLHHGLNAMDLLFRLLRFGLWSLSLLQAQREYLDTQIRGLSNSHVVHSGIQRQKVPLVPAHGRIKEIALPLQV